MRRRSAWLLLMAGVVFTNFASAVGLGELTLKSALNQPLNAEIKLLNTGDLSKNELLPNLASHEDFARAGVERVFFLTGIKFNVKFKDDGNVVIVLTSDQIVREPFLNFLVEIHWPNGRILREYTVLLDPPVFAATAPAPIRQAPAATSEPAPQAVASTPTRAQPSPAQAPRAGPTTTRGEGKVVIKKNDTLWGIARDNRPDSDLTIRQTMMAIQRENPHAFINNNINLIRAGQVLRVPDAAEIRSISSGEAYAETSRQNREWREKQTVASASNDDDYAAPAPATAPDDEGGTLKLVGDDPAEEAETLAETAAGATAEDGGSEVGAGGSRLSGAGDEADAGPGTGIAAEKLEELESQLQDMKRLLALKDEQLALLQATAANNATANAAGAQDNAATKTAPATTASDPSTAKGLLEMVTQNPIYIGIAILGFLAILVIMGALSRRKSDAEEYPVDLQAAIADAGTDVDLPDDFVDELDGGSANLEPVAQKAGAATPETDSANGEAEAVRKAIEEADIYIAYGRAERAQEMLQPALEEYPENTQLLLKMAEISIALSDATGLAAQEGKLQAIGDTQAIQRLQTLKHSAQQAADAAALAADTSDEPAVADSAEDDTLAGAEALDELESLEEERTSTPDNVVEFDSGSAAKQEENVEPLEFSLDEEDLFEDDAAVSEGAALDQEELADAAAGAEDEEDFLGDTDESATKLELARAYIDMADKDAAEDILNEVMEEGSDEQKQKARQLLEGLG